MKKAVLILCSGVIAIGGATVVAGQIVPAAPRLRFAEPYRPAGQKGDTQIIGTVIDIRQSPVRNAKLQLRNLANGVVAQEGTSNENGEYAFNLEESGTYVVEMVMVDGNVVALSNAGTLSRFETMQTVIQLPGRWDALNTRVVMPQEPSSFVGMSAQNTMTAQTLEMAVQQSIQPVDAGEAVSPVRP